MGKPLDSAYMAEYQSQSALIQTTGASHCVGKGFNNAGEEALG